MATVRILVEGYTTKEKPGRACSTVTLIQDGHHTIVVDPGSVSDHSVISNTLKKEGLTVNDIDIVFLTHSHLDHYYNIGLFPKATIIDYWGAWKKDTWKAGQKKLSKNISIIETPGHSDDSITLLAKTKQGIIAVCGDVFWKENYPNPDPYANNQKKLVQSRKKVLGIADWVIPGHGNIFRVKKVNK